ncbi:unnamed protein product [Dovyalis caffra]|uniref:Uncharacterized protein n=1 Tax=Dovyalis caffra TaxID=77055 RepID=A0AAV1R126_9ROSI|nr:unnamed protein product [Dovyalis caffra]
MVSKTSIEKAKREDGRLHLEELLVMERNVVDKLGLPISNTMGNSITLSNEEKLNGVGNYVEVEVKLPDLTIIEDFFPLTISNVDVILRLKWLSTVGESRDDWR